MEISDRKTSHIEICLKNKVEHGSTWFEYVHLIHNPLPDIDFGSIDISTSFLGYEISAPIIIEGMTGGHPSVERLNKNIAEAAERSRVPVEVGSIRAALRDKSLLNTYRIVRDMAPSVPVISNIGIDTINHADGPERAKAAVELLNADALAVHLNPLQEAIQPEGEPHFRLAADSIRRVVEYVDVPVIVKEVGFGIPAEVARMVEGLGVAMIDVAGRGGTNWAVVEGIRADKHGKELQAEAAKTFSSWGIPTAASVLEVVNVVNIPVIGSGGIRNGLDVAKAIVLGSSYAGLALPILKAAVKGYKEIMKLLDRLKYELKLAMFLTGSADLGGLKNAKFVITGELLQWVKQRKIRI